MKEFPRKFLSRRDKNGSHFRSKSQPPPTDKTRPLKPDAFLSFFKKDEQKAKEDTEKSKNIEDKITAIQRRLDELNISNITPEHIKDIMSSNFASGDPERTTEFIDIEQKAASGVIVPYNPNTTLLGAENRGGVTCYIDSLLFAMFCKLDAFECMLNTSFPTDDPRAKLVKLLRVWVNMLRSGKLIHTDLTKLIQDTLGDCGWPDARLLEQQDTSEAFAFLTETLQLPLLSLQVDLFHQGRRDDDDHKVVYERLLNLAVPPDPEGKGIKLEDCLEEYFNAKVDVLRDSEEMKKSLSEDPSTEDRPGLVHRNTLRLLRDEETGVTSMLSSSPVDMYPLQPFPTKSSIASVSSHSAFPVIEGEPASDEAGGADSAITRKYSSRNRSGSVIQRVVLDENGKPTDEAVVDGKSHKRKGSIVVKAITIPAWQFFRLIPWNAVSSNEPQNDVEVAKKFQQRPVVGICLKRYAMTESGQPQRHNTFIDIPDSLRLPHFMLGNGPNLEADSNGLSTEYKLVLQSVVCHRGDSLQSGHYITFARVAPKLLIDNRRHNFDPPPDYEEAQWVLFDDLEETRVTYVDNFKEALKAEMPYLLFYQVVPMVDVACPSTDGTATGPPSYQESKQSMELQTSSITEGSLSTQSKPPSIRLSFENEPVPVKPFHESTSYTTFGGSNPSSSRRQSVAVNDSIPATPEGHSPVILPSDDATPSRLSRAASRFTLGRSSRPTSQSGEGRLSISMGRFSGLRKVSKDPVPDQSESVAASINTAPSESPSTQSQETQVDQTKSTATKNGKAKEKDRSKEKTKQKQAGTQPERECVVM